MKKVRISILAVVILTFGIVIGVSASDWLRDVTAHLNYELRIVNNDEVQVMKDANGNTVVPLTYNDTTYLPVRAIADILGVQIDWDEESYAVLLNGSKAPELIDVHPGYITTGENILDTGAAKYVLPEVTSNYIEKISERDALKHYGITCDDNDLKEAQREVQQYIDSVLNYLKSEGFQLSEEGPDLPADCSGTLLTKGDEEVIISVKEKDLKIYTPLSYIDISVPVY